MASLLGLMAYSLILLTRLCVPGKPMLVRPIITSAERGSVRDATSAWDRLDFPSSTKKLCRISHKLSRAILLDASKPASTNRAKTNRMDFESFSVGYLDAFDLIFSPAVETSRHCRKLLAADGCCWDVVVLVVTTTTLGLVSAIQTSDWASSSKN